MQAKLPMISRTLYTGLFIVALCAAGCSVIIGKEDAAAQKGLSFLYVETLRNEASLRGESFKDIAYNTDRATTLQAPNSVYADAFRVYVTDASPARVFIFDRGNRNVTILNNAAPTAGSQLKLLSPSGIAVDSAGVVFVSDAQQGKVFGFDRNGNVSLVLGGTLGPISRQINSLSRPGGLAVDNFRNRLYVADTHTHQVKVFSTNGDHLFDIGATGKKSEDFKFPGAVALDSKGNVFVLDTLRRSVYEYDSEGKFLKSFSLSGTMPGYAIQPKGIAVDADGHLYVTDSVSNNILVFDPEGIFLLTWGRTGSLSGDFWMPAGIYIDEQNRIYIADQTNGRVQTFQYVK